MTLFFGGRWTLHLYHSKKEEPNQYRLRDGLKAVDFKNNRVILNEIYKNILKRRRLTPFVGGSTVYYELR